MQSPASAALPDSPSIDECPNRRQQRFRAFEERHQQDIESLTSSRTGK
jgi:hypothetical protein